MNESRTFFVFLENYVSEKAQKFCVRFKFDFFVSVFFFLFPSIVIYVVSKALKSIGFFFFF